MYFIVNLKNGWANFRHFVGAHEGSAIVMSFVGNVFGRYYDSDFRHKNARREVVSSSSLFYNFVFFYEAHKIYVRLEKMYRTLWARNQ